MTGAAPYELSSRDFATGPSVDLCLANYRYVAVDAPPQKIWKTHREAGLVAFSSHGHASLRDKIFYSCKMEPDQPIGQNYYFSDGHCSNGVGH